MMNFVRYPDGRRFEDDLVEHVEPLILGYSCVMTVPVCRPEPEQLLDCRQLVVVARDLRQFRMYVREVGELVERRCIRYASRPEELNSISNTDVLILPHAHKRSDWDLFKRAIILLRKYPYGCDVMDLDPWGGSIPSEAKAS